MPLHSHSVPAPAASAAEPTSAALVDVSESRCMAELPALVSSTDLPMASFRQPTEETTVATAAAEPHTFGSLRPAEAGTGRYEGATALLTSGAERRDESRQSEVSSPAFVDAA